VGISATLALIEMSAVVITDSQNCLMINHSHKDGTMKHVISGSGAHRIECGLIVGEMIGYRGIAQIENDGKVFCATTEYWAGDLPAFFEMRPMACTQEYQKDGITEEDKRRLKASMDMVKTLFPSDSNPA
jgi:hypothetical protein